MFIFVSQNFTQRCGSILLALSTKGDMLLNTSTWQLLVVHKKSPLGNKWVKCEQTTFLHTKINEGNHD